LAEPAAVLLCCVADHALAFNCDVTGPSSQVVTVGDSWDVGVAVEFDVDCARRKTVAFSRTVDGNADIYVTDDIGTVSVRLTVDPGADAEPAWSPDGSRIAFQSDRDGKAEIYVMNADGSNQVRLCMANSKVRENACPCRGPW